MSISVLIPLYNATRYVRSVVESVLREAPCETEIIVVDDGSTDGGLKTVADLPGVKSFRVRHQGAAPARNLAIRKAQGEFITFVDQDDLLCAESLRWRWEYLKQNPSEIGVGGRIASVINENGDVDEDLQRQFQERFAAWPEAMTVEAIARRKFPPVLWLFLFRREIFEKLGGMDESFLFSHDIDFLYRVSQLAPVPILEKPVMHYRIHESNMTVRKERGQFVTNRRAVAESQWVDQRYQPLLPSY